jgi:hypothetical protein
MVMQEKMQYGPKERGVRIPVDPEIYEPVLDELEQLGIICHEETKIHIKT